MTIIQIYVARYNILTNLQDKRVLVTGGAGFIGSETVNQNLSDMKKFYLKKKNGTWKKLIHMMTIDKKSMKLLKKLKNLS